MENRTVFKKDDRVFHCDFKWGTIIDIVSDSKYPIIVKFGNDKFGFTNDGKELEDSTPSLSFTEYDFVNGGFSQERPIEVPKRGAICWVRNKETDPWLIRHFVEMNDRLFLVSQANANFGNSYLYLTTINPYENEK